MHTHTHTHTHTQPRNDMLPALDVLKEYLGLIFTYPDVVHIYKGALSKVKDCDKMKGEGRIDVSGVCLCELCDSVRVCALCILA